MIKKMIICLSALSLTACLAPNQLYIAQATYLCKSHGNIYTLNPITGVTCKDGTWYGRATINETIIPVEEIQQYYESTN